MLNILRILIALAGVVLTLPAAAQTYPSQPIRLIAPFQSTPEEARGFLAAEVERYSKLIKAKGITAN